MLGASLYVILTHFSDEEVWTIDSILYVVCLTREPLRSFVLQHTNTFNNNNKNIQHTELQKSHPCRYGTWFAMAMRVVAINHFVVMPTFSTAWWRCGCCERESSENTASSRDNDSFNTSSSRIVVSDNDSSAPRRRQKRQSNNSKKKKRRQRSESESIRLTLPQEQPQSKLLPPIEE